MSIRSAGTLGVLRRGSEELLQRPFAVQLDEGGEAAGFHCLHCNQVTAPNNADFAAHDCSDKPRSVTEGGQRPKLARAPRPGAGEDTPNPKED